jgi:beta-ureidopropionase / N-carbamoyl-L-amino-acid hydrolase
MADGILARVNGPRLLERLDVLARIGAHPDGGVTRLAYTEEDRRALALVAEWMREAGLEPRVDAAGNLIGRRAGAVPAELPQLPLVVGSHIDTVPRGGKYDGALGTIAAIEAVQTLFENQIELAHPLEIVAFQNEEGGLVGSRALSGELEESELDEISQGGRTIRDGIAALGGDPSRLIATRRPAGSIAGYLELHIEQGGVLEAEGTPIGVVEGIVGIGWWEVVVEGFANHAGTTPMRLRQDALLAAARFVDAVHRVVTRRPGSHVGTVGRLHVEPGATNVIPGRVTLSLELRDLEAAVIACLYEDVVAEGRRIEQETRTTVRFRKLSGTAPAPTDAHIRGLIAEAANELGLDTKLMPSGAGHDAQNMARLGPAGMIFIPSIGGITHSPLELSRPQDIVMGAEVLLHTLWKVDGDPTRPFAAVRAAGR